MPKYTYNLNIISFNYKSIAFNIGYQITDISYEYGFVKISAKPKSDVRYLPSIYDLHDFADDGALYGFEISTTSYGKTMMVDDIRKLIKGYEQAIEVVEILKEKFIK